MGWILIAEDKASEGEPLLLEAQRKLLTMLGPQHPETVQATSRLIDYYHAHHRDADAAQVHAADKHQLKITEGSRRPRLAVNCLHLRESPMPNRESSASSALIAALFAAVAIVNVAHAGAREESRLLTATEVLQANQGDARCASA